MPLDMLITGRIATLSGDSGFGWVEAIGIRDGRIAFAGSEVYLETRADPFTERIRLEPDQVAIPGLTDAHLHLTQAALASRHVDLGDAASLDEGLARLREAHERLPGGAWLEGHGWDSDRWGDWPTADALESVAPGRRAALWAHDHHALWASHAALREAGLPSDDPAGGVIRRASDGSPAGVLCEAATRLVTIHVPAPTADELDAALIEVGQHLIRLGVVACHDRVASLRTRPCGTRSPPTRGYPTPAGCRFVSMRACATTPSRRPSNADTGAGRASARTRMVGRPWAGRSASPMAPSGRGPPRCSRTSRSSRTGHSPPSSVAASG